MATHELKILPEYYEPIKSGLKKFEIRENDRDFMPEDYLIMRAYDAEKDEYLDLFDEYPPLLCRVSYVFYGGAYGLKNDYCVMSINVLYGMRG